MMALGVAGGLTCIKSTCAGGKLSDTRSSLSINPGIVDRDQLVWGLHGAVWLPIGFSQAQEITPWQP